MKYPWVFTQRVGPMKDIDCGCWEHFNLSFQKTKKCISEPTGDF